jgi:L-idonate 5-dehydrogenase
MKACVLHAPKDLRVETSRIPDLGPGQVRIDFGAGGICGSDLHYYLDGGFGTVRLKEPMILGHEVSGTVAEIGAGVTRVKPGDKLAVNPSRPCGKCRYCLAGSSNHCLEMRFYGSAMIFPHVQGAFREVLVAEEAQCFPVPPTLSLGIAAFAEPLSVALHAVRRAGSLLGKRVLVTGAGPIGALVMAAARRAGAIELVATDVVDEPLAIVRRMGVDATINVARSPEALAKFEADKGYFDVSLECSGNGAALRSSLGCVKAGGIVVQVGLANGDVSMPMNFMIAREIDYRGTFRFHEEFGWAVDCLSKGLIDVEPLLTDTISVSSVDKAFELAADRRRAMKVQLCFD